MNHASKLFDKMYKILICLLLFSGVLEAKTCVLVSIAPQKFLVERVGGENVHVEVIVPPGANAHTYEPTTRQMLDVQKGEIWFRLGESFEARMLASLPAHMEVVDQRVGIDLIEAGCGCCTHDAHDPHIWLSPRLLKIEAAQIAETLCKHHPELTETFRSNLLALHKECDQLEEECRSLLAHSPQRFIMVSHPAFGYFCRDYGLEQLSVEMEGREPTPRFLTNLISKARACRIKRVFLQLQHNPKGGKRVAQELKAETVFVDPYIENVIENLRTLAHLFAQL